MRPLLREAHVETARQANPQDLDTLRGLGEAFSIPGAFLSAAPFGRGHIHDTFAAAYGPPASPRRYVFQRLNARVFPDLDALMENFARVTRHQRAKALAAGGGDAERRHLWPLAAADGRLHHVDAGGAWWRCCRLIEGALSLDTVETPAQAREAARVFGAFQRDLRDLEGPPLRETLPRFHHTPGRLEDLARAAAADPQARLEGCRGLVDACLAQAGAAGRLAALQAAGGLPTRITHNDCKLNNALLDAATGRGLCAIDLDTVMPGLAAYDFGDLVRTTAAAAGEAEGDARRIGVRWDCFDAIVAGFLDGAADGLGAAELESLAEGAWIIPFETGVRFLTDHLNGDRYFRISRPGLNLQRAQNQAILAGILRAQRPRMLEKLFAAAGFRREVGHL